MSATLLSDKAILPQSPHASSSTSTTTTASLISSAPTTPALLSPSFEPNTPLYAESTVPPLIALLQQPRSDPRDILTELEIPDIDLSQNISTLLKVGTSRAHVEAENSKGAAALVKGELELQEYIRWLAVLWRVYDALELGLDEHASNGVLAPTYDPSVLARAESLSRDITFLLTLLPDSVASRVSSVFPEGPLPPFPLPAFLSEVFTHPPPALATYLDHIKALSATGSTAPGLLAHSYVRYLGDLSGGQFIAARIKRAYNLTGADGLRFYHFDLANRQGGGDDSKADGRRKAGEVKDWFRRGMDEGVGEDEDLKVDLIREANLAFALNTYLFSTIRLPASPFFPTTSTKIDDPSSLETSSSETAVAPVRQSPRDALEKLLLLTTTMIIGYAVSHFVSPFVKGYLSTKLPGKYEL